MTAGLSDRERRRAGARPGRPRVSRRRLRHAEPRAHASAAPTLPSPTHALRLRGTAAAPTALVFSLAGDQIPLGNGCTRLLAPAQVIGSLAAGAGLSTWNLPLPAELTPSDLFCQSAEVVANGRWLGTVALSNGLKVRVGGSGSMRGAGPSLPPCRRLPCGAPWSSHPGYRLWLAQLARGCLCGLGLNAYAALRM